MKQLLVVLVLGGLLAAAWFFVRPPDNVEESEVDAETEVAVRVAEIATATLRAYITAYGTVEPEPAGSLPAASARIAPSVPGVVVAVEITEGQLVARNDLLFQLDSRAADIAVQFAATTVERERQLLAVDGTSEKAVQAAEQQLEAARVEQSLLRVRSPLAGTVTRLHVRPGEAVDLATVMAEIVDLDRLIISAGVPSAEVRALAAGQPTEVIVAGTGQTLNGTLVFIGPDLDPRTDTAQVRASLPADSGLRPGQRVSLRIVSEEHSDRLAVPVDSVVTNADGTSVIAIVSSGQAKQVPVTTGLRDRGLIEVDGEGLQAGMTVVTEGAYGLPAETRIRVVEN